VARGGNGATGPQAARTETRNLRAANPTASALPTCGPS